MTCKISILDFDRQNLLKAATPETIARTSSLWGIDINDFSPWTRTCSNRFDNPTDKTDQWTWQSGKNGDGPTVYVCGQTTSTMDAVWHFMKNRQMTIWDSVIAVEQTAGRGQQKRQWISPPGNIHASWLWPLPTFGGQTETDWGGLLSLVVGFVFARAFGELNVPVKIKWPNDLLIHMHAYGEDQTSGNDRKFAGILVERREKNIVVGIGINVSYSPEDSRLREEFAVPATSLLEQGYEMQPLSLWTTLVEKGKSIFKQLIQTLTPWEFVTMIDKQMAWVGKKVQIRQVHAEVFDAVILGLSKDGGLRIKTGSTEKVMYSGSIIPV